MVLKKIIPFIVSLALFMDALDTTIINTAIPAMAGSLHVPPVDLKIALISYLLSLAIFIPVSGWVADKYGIKRIFMGAIGLFTLSSVACGFATSLSQLIIYRALQGVGGAIILPIGRLIILHSFDRHELVQAMNHVVMIAALGLMVGPFAGGYLTDHLSWHWIFWVNAPMGILAFLVSGYYLDVDTRPKNHHPFDTLGFLLFGGGLAGLTFALSDISETTASETKALMVMSVSITMLISYFWRARGKRYSVINMELFQSHIFRISFVANLCCRLGFGALPFLLPLLLQIGLGYSAQLSGMLLMPVALGILLVKSIALSLLRLFGFKRLLLINTCLVGFSLWSFQIVNQHTPLYLIAILTFLFGFLISLQYSGMNSLAYAEIPAEQFSSATSVVSTVQQLAQSFGVAVSALVLRYNSSLQDKAIALTPAVFHQTFFIMGCLTVLSLVIFLRLDNHDGYQMLHSPKKDAVPA